MQSDVFVEKFHTHYTNSRCDRIPFEGFGEVLMCHVQNSSQWWLARRGTEPCARKVYFSGKGWSRVVKIRNWISSTGCLHVVGCPCPFKDGLAKRRADQSTFRWMGRHSSTCELWSFFITSFKNCIKMPSSALKNMMLSNTFQHSFFCSPLT